MYMCMYPSHRASKLVCSVAPPTTRGAGRRPGGRYAGRRRPEPKATSSTATRRSGKKAAAPGCSSSLPGLRIGAGRGQRRSRGQAARRRCYTGVGAPQPVGHPRRRGPRQGGGQDFGQTARGVERSRGHLDGGHLGAIPVRHRSEPEHRELASSARRVPGQRGSGLAGTLTERAAGNDRTTGPRATQPRSPPTEHA